MLSYQSLLASILLIEAATMSASEKRNSENRTAKMHSIQITVDGRNVHAELEDNATSRDFVALLPLEIELEDYSATEKISRLPKRLSSEGAPPGFDPEVGDIAYYAPWGNLAVFYKDFGYSEKLIKLGRVKAGVEHLEFSGAKTAKIFKQPK